MSRKLIIFNQRELFAGDGDNGLRSGAAGGKLSADAHFFHDVAEAVDGGVVVQIGAAGELLNFGAGDDELIALWLHFPGARELLGTELDDRGSVGSGTLGSVGSDVVPGGIIPCYAAVL